MSLLIIAIGAPSASAVAPAPGWTVDSVAAPSSFSTADNAGCLASIERQSPLCDSYEVTARNAGAQPSTGAITIDDTVPQGLAVQEVHLIWPALAKTVESLLHVTFQSAETELFPFLERSGFCSRTPVRCTTASPGFELPVSSVPDEEIRLNVYVTAEAPASRPLANEASISGGGAPTVSTETRNGIGTPPPFGFSLFDFAPYGPDGALDTQAGDHPYEQTTTIGLNNDLRITNEGGRGSTSVEDPRDIVTELPVGFVGSILAAPQCTFAKLETPIEPDCPPGTIVGHIETWPIYAGSIDSPIYNMTPEKGVPAEFGYVDILEGSHVFYVHVVPSPQGYRLEVINPEIPQLTLRRIVVTFYGDPAEKDRTNNAPIPFFTNPSDCGGEEPTATIFMDSWLHPARFNPDGTPLNIEEEVDGRKVWARAESKSPPVTGCDALRFPADIGAQPTTHEADTPSGVDFQIKLPQSETMGVPATPTLKKVVETFPPGFTVDPSAGDGLAACSEAQIGWLGPLGPHGEKMPSNGVLNFDAAPPQCPEASKVGSLELESPLVGERKLQGEIFLARQYENPYPEPGHPEGSLIGLYVVVHDPITGVLIKIAGRSTLNPNDGQIIGEFDENPNLPFSDLELHFFGGPRAEFATPESCGVFTTTTELVPYSFPESGPPAPPFDRFLINEACPTGAFSPSFAAGSTNLQAGAYTPFVASFERSDTDQELAGLSVTLPAGLSAKVGGVTECSEAQIREAEAGTGGCPEASQVGTVKAGVGPGPDPFFATGKAYWTGPYNGGPFGLAVVVPAVAGPFNFGTVVVRQSIRINPVTAQVTDVSDSFPTIINGIPLRMRRVDVELNRPGFTFNPTNCSKFAFTGTVSGFPLGAPTTLNAHTVGFATQTGATSSFSTPFQVTNCGLLGFKPAFKVSTSGGTSRANGASLSVRLTYPNAPFGSQANIKSVKVDLPKQLPSRLTTLQKACPEKTFEANPAGCPAGSIVGHANAITPILGVPLTGPAYFVSYGGAKFPELVIVLQGDGVTLDLHGETFINKAGITSSTFHAIPDAPVGSFELTLPEGRDSALAANGNLCKSTLAMPTAFVAQNGAEIHESTPIGVTGCKPVVNIVKHSVRGATIAIAAGVPSAGKLVASGAGLSRVSKSVGKAGNVTFTLKLSGHEQAVLKSHPGRKLKVAIKLVFTPAHGKKLTAGVSVNVG